MTNQLTIQLRPHKWADIIGQENAVNILSSTIKEERIFRSYLIYGPYGTGKTSIARILAKALMCPNRQRGQTEGCGKCKTCESVKIGNNPDFIEVDAASHRGIDGVRSLRHQALYAPISDAKRKVFLIDESHRFTPDASSALLKVLEEPHTSAIFILVTTNFPDVLDTIRSRSLKILLRKVPQQQIINYLKGICQQKKIQYENKALRILAEVSGGHLRDALMSLDLCRPKITFTNSRLSLGFALRIKFAGRRDVSIIKS